MWRFAAWFQSPDLPSVTHEQSFNVPYKKHSDSVCHCSNPLADEFWFPEVGLCSFSIQIKLLPLCQENSMRSPHVHREFVWQRFMHKTEAGDGDRMSCSSGLRPPWDLNHREAEAGGFDFTWSFFHVAIARIQKWILFFFLFCFTFNKVK